jgi:hypothetical protein
VVVGAEVVVAAPLGEGVGAPWGSRLLRRLVRRARSVRVCWAFSLYLREQRRARWRFSEHRDRPPVTVIFVRERIARAAARPCRRRVRMVSVCPAPSLYLREHVRARCRSTEHSGRPPLIRTVTRELAANTVPPPPAIKTPASADTTRRRLMQPFSALGIAPPRQRRCQTEPIPAGKVSYAPRWSASGHPLRPRAAGLAGEVRAVLEPSDRRLMARPAHRRCGVSASSAPGSGRLERR